MDPSLNYPISVYILAGGKSSRMGSDKGLAIINNKALVENVITHLRALTQTIIIVSNNSAYEQFGFPVISDMIKDAGPAGGIQAALSHSVTSSNFIVSCDMPFISTAAAEYMIKASANSQITVPVFKQKLEPLFGIYSKECLSLWTELVKKGTFKLQLLIDHFDSKRIDVDNNPLFNKGLFTNINTQEDFENALNKFTNEN